MLTFGEKLRLLRESLNLRQEEVALHIPGLTNQTLSLYERNERHPDIYTLQSLCDFYNVSCEFMLGSSDHIICAL